MGYFEGKDNTIFKTLKLIWPRLYILGHESLVWGGRRGGGQGSTFNAVVITVYHFHFAAPYTGFISRFQGKFFRLLDHKKIART